MLRSLPGASIRTLHASSSSHGHSGKMTAYARLFLRVSSRAVCEWTLERENEASFSPNFKPSVDGNEFYYLKGSGTSTEMLQE